MYIIRDKKSKAFLCKNPAPVSRKLRGIELYPHFDPETMEVLKFDGEHLPQYYKVDENGTILKKTFREKAMEGLVEFSWEFLTQPIEPVRETEGTDSTKLVIGQSRGIQAIELGFEAELIKTRAHCDLALKMLNEEFERRLAQTYPPGLEMKITKALVEWLYEDRPSDDSREQAYQTMKSEIATLKNEYKPLRDQLKTLREETPSEPAPSAKPSVPSSVAEASPDERWLKADLQAYMDARQLPYLVSDTKAVLLKKIQMEREGPVDTWTKADLKMYMNAHEIAYNSSDTKSDLFEKIAAAQA